MRNIKEHHLIKTLIAYLCSTMLAGCTTLDFGIVDPTEKVKITTPLTQSFAVNVSLKFPKDPGAVWREHLQRN